MRIAISAGEPSGDALIAPVVSRLIQRGSTVYGICGDKMMAAGAHNHYDSSQMAVIGLTEILPRLWRIWRIGRSFVKQVIHDQPHVFIGVDFPGFNLRCEKYIAYNSHIPIIHIVCPSVWAWRPWRLKRIVAIVDHIVVLYPFEVEMFAKINKPVTFIGFPHAHALYQRSLDRVPTRHMSNFSITILLGSRIGEVRSHLPRMLETARLLALHHPGTVFHMPLATVETYQYVTKFIKNKQPLQMNIMVHHGNTHNIIAESSLCYTALGTAVVECALVGCPVIAYCAPSWLTAQLIRTMLIIPYIALPNILLKKRWMPEFWGSEVKPVTLVQEGMRLLQSKEYQQECLKNAKILHDMLYVPDSVDLLVDVIENIIHKKSV